MEQTPVTIIQIGERAFKPLLESTMAHDTWVMRKMEEADLVNFHMEPDESPDDFAKRLLGKVISSGQEFELLGALLIPSDMTPTEWTPEIAHHSALHFANQTDEVAKQTLASNISAMVLGFFQSGLASVTTSPDSSRAAEVEDEPESQSRIAAAVSSASGTQSSGRSAGGDSIGTSRSSRVGLYARFCSLMRRSFGR